MSEHILQATVSNFEGVYFGILNDERGRGDLRMPGWAQQSFSSTRHIPNSDRNVTFFSGRGPLTVSYLVYFQNETDYAAIQALVGTSGTLQVPKRICELVGTGVTEVYWHGRVYKQVTDVLLLNAGPPMVGMDDSVEHVLSFQRNTRPV